MIVLNKGEEAVFLPQEQRRKRIGQGPLGTKKKPCNKHLVSAHRQFSLALRSVL